MKKVVAVFIILVLIGIMLTGCRQADRVSYNLSQEADSFNVTRKLTVINQRKDRLDLLKQMLKVKREKTTRKFYLQK